jgi:polyisoprenoid-binding protein YceI
MKRGMVLGAGLMAVVVASGAAVTGVTLWKAQPAASAPAAASAPFSVDNVHSTALFRVRHNNVSFFYGRFNTIKGTFTIDPAKPEASMFDIAIDLESVDSNNRNRDEHLRGNDFFAASEFPTATFKSTSVKSAGENVMEVTGNLTIRGTTKPVTVRIEHTGTGAGRRGGTVQGFEASFTIKRSDFGVSYQVGPGLSDEVNLILGIQGRRD